jgi:transposase
MRATTSVLRGALVGHFTEHHAFLLIMMLDRTDALTAQIGALATRIGDTFAPHGRW